MKKTVVFLIVTAMLFAFAGCGKTDDGKKNDVTKIDLPEPVANVNPEEMDWGWNEYTEEKFENETSDIWYPAQTGKNDSDYMYFVNGHSAYKVTDGEEKNSGWLLSEDNHMVVDPEYTEFDFDIVFIDNFTLYDYVTETYYLRGNLSEYQKLFEGKKFDCTSDEGRGIEFKADGIAYFYYRGEPEECKWEVIAQRIVQLQFSDYDDEYYVFYNEDGSVKCLDMDTEITDSAFYPAK